MRRIFGKDWKSMFTFRTSNCIHKHNEGFPKMALAIKHTPALEGKTSKRFNEIIKSPVPSSVSEEQIRKIQQLTESILSKRK